jgi:hypothetical protein
MIYTNQQRSSPLLRWQEAEAYDLQIQGLERLNLVSPAPIYSGLEKGNVSTT